MNNFIIIRRRVVTQVATEQYQAETKAEALAQANKDQASGLAYADITTQANEWFDLDDVIEYPVLGEEAILASTEV